MDPSIKSMTAFARETAQSELGELTWELRSVNHRFLEIFIRLPEELRILDPRIRTYLRERLNRGKLDCTLRYVPMPGTATRIQINQPYLQQLTAAAEEVAGLLGRPMDLQPFTLLQWPGVIQEQPVDMTPLQEGAMELLETTLEVLIATRAREGARLREGLLERCDRLATCIAEVRARMPQILEEARRRIRDRLAEVQAELEPQRLEQELVILAQRLDVDEEMDRLEAHLREVRQVLGRGHPVGRRLDFLLQELNREANTLGAKSSDVDLTRVAVEMKVLIEQMREQVQNIE